MKRVTLSVTLMADNEQWKSDGNCSICRRKTYCKKACSASKKAVQHDVMRAFVRTEAGNAMLTIGACAESMTGYSYLGVDLERKG